MPQKPVMPMKTILCPTDWSEPSLEALDLALKLSRQQNAQLLLLHVVPPLQPVLGIAANAHFENAVRDEADEQLRELLARHRTPDVNTPDVKAIVLVRTGEASQEINRVAFQTNADLVVMSTHGHSGWTHWALGSVAEGVLQSAPCPVLSIGSGATEIRRGQCLEFPFCEILAPLDWSDASENSTRAATEIADEFGARCLMLHVFEAPDCMETEFAEEMEWLKRKTAADEQFSFLRQQYPTWRDAEHLAECGDATDVIVDVARVEGIDLIVIPRNSGQAGSHRIGSVSEAVLRDAPCPVLTMPPAASETRNASDARRMRHQQVSHSPSARVWRNGDILRNGETRKRVPA